MDYAFADRQYNQSDQNDHDEIGELEDDEGMEEEESGELTDNFDVSSNDDPDEAPWLKTFEVEEATREGLPIAYIVAHRIGREKIRAIFYFKMVKVSQAASELAYDLFDRWGCVKNEFLNHPIKRGTGVWGNELNEGQILFFESINVDKNLRRRGIGTKFAQDFLAKVWKKNFRLAESEDERSKFAVVWPEFSTTRYPQHDNLSPEDVKVHLENGNAAAQSFWRSLGFRRIGTSRWFALAKNPAHPSHKLPPEADYNPPQKKSEQNDFENSIHARISRRQPNPEGFDTQTQDAEQDDDLVAFVQYLLRVHGSIHPSWTSVDKDGNTIAHLATEWPQLLRWLLAQPLYNANHLFTFRNYEGETPAEMFESLLKDRRVRRRLRGSVEHMSDLFRGYNEKDTDTLLLLRGLNPTTCAPELRQRVKWGCTCGECISYLSPRVRYALYYQAYVFHQKLSAASPADLKGWIECAIECLEHLSPALLQKLLMEEHVLLRDGLEEIFRFVHMTLEQRKQIPNFTNVERLIYESPGLGQLSALEFIYRGGSIPCIVLACFEEAIGSSTYLGNGEFEMYEWKRLKNLPKCRNDNEFIMARNAYKENNN